MSKRTVRADARPMPKPSKDPDAAIFALAEQCAAAAKVRDEAEDVLDRATERCRRISNPLVIIRTEKDRLLGLFVGPRVGSAYGREDIPVLRALVRKNSILTNSSGENDYATWNRACEIIDALRDLKKEEAREGRETGLTEAQRRYDEASDAFEELAELLVKMQASTLEGAFAKARIMRPAFGEEGEPLDPWFTDILKDHMSRRGPDADAFAMSLTRDLIALAAERREASK